jgi:hypothetical protein
VIWHWQADLVHSLDITFWIQSRSSVKCQQNKAIREGGLFCCQVLVLCDPRMTPQPFPHGNPAASVGNSDARIPY